MNREQLIVHTQKYMLALSQGVDPISGLPIQEGDAAQTPVRAMGEKGSGEGRTAPLPQDCQKTPGELERAAALSNFQSCPAACTVGTGRFL